MFNTSNYFLYLGVSSHDDGLWDKLFKDIYLKYQSLSIPWYPVLGNHDWGYGLTGVKAQIERTTVHENDDFWVMPSTNWSKVFRSSDADDAVTLQVIFIDTTTLAPSSNECCNSRG